MNRKKKNYIIASLVLVTLSLYISFLYMGIHYSVGRSGIDAKIRVFLIELSKIANDKSKLNEKINSFTMKNYVNGEFKFTIHEKIDDCFMIDDYCIQAKSVNEYYGKNDIYILGLKNGKIEHVQDMGPHSFFDWIISW